MKKVSHSLNIKAHNFYQFWNLSSFKISINYLFIIYTHFFKFKLIARDISTGGRRVKSFLKIILK